MTAMCYDLIMKRTIIILVSAVLAALIVGLVVQWKTGRLPFVSKKECPAFISPVDVSHVVSVLYPGQLRGGDYKAHGGFRMDSKTNDIIVKAPLDAKLTAAGRYIEIGEVQNIMDFKTDCGLEYRFDHLLTLSPKFQAIMAKLPEAQESRSNTYGVRPAVAVVAGEVIATAVGFTKSEHGVPNVSFDFGLYDRRNKNEASKNQEWAKAHKEHTYTSYHGVCWLDWLPADDAAHLKTLPGGDYLSGKQSDYCH